MAIAESKLDDIITYLRAAEKGLRDLDGYDDVNSEADTWLCLAENQLIVAVHLLDTEVRRAVKRRRKKPRP